jgi:hypothetical protein
MSDTEKFEPKRQFRWTFDVAGIHPYTLRSIKMIDRKTIELKICRLHTDDISVVPELGSSGLLKFLSPAGDVYDQYTIKWDRMLYLPFVALDYSSSESVESVITLLNCEIQKKD